MKRIFGPVPSRRLGISLGIDVVPYKTCTFDCVYCECGATTDLRVERGEFFPLEEVVEELTDALAEMHSPPDVITMSGAGEPTLYSRLGELIDSAKEAGGLPVAVITNSSLLGDPGVREEVARADIVLPSLDAAMETAFKRINRPHPSCDLGSIMEGLGSFLDDYEGTVLFEVLLIEGYNTGDEELSALAGFLSRHRVDSVQLNTAVRPGTEKGIRPLTRERLESICEWFGPDCEIVASAGARTTHEDFAAAGRILRLLERRPCTAEDIRNALGIPAPGLAKMLGVMLEDGSVVAEEHAGGTYYTARDRAGS